MDEKNKCEINISSMESLSFSSAASNRMKQEQQQQQQQQQQQPQQPNNEIKISLAWWSHQSPQLGGCLYTTTLENIQQERRVALPSIPSSSSSSSSSVVAGAVAAVAPNNLPPPDSDCRCWVCGKANRIHWEYVLPSASSSNQVRMHTVTDI